MSRKNISDIYPLSFAQQGMLYDTLRDPASGMHIEQFVCTLIGNLNAALLQEAWQAIVNHYAILHSGFVWETSAEPVQVVLQKVEITLRMLDWRGLAPDVQQEQLQAYLFEERHRPFKLAQPPLIRMALLQMQDQAYEFVWTYHHILMDGWCNTIIIKHLLQYYQALLAGRQIHIPPERPYKDYIRWLRKQDLEAGRAFWKKQLHGFTRPTLPGREKASPQSPTVQAIESHALALCHLPAEFSQRLQALANRQQITVNTLFQGVWALILSRYSERDDILFGITVSGRPAELSDVESMVGLFIATLPLRIQVPPQEHLWHWLKHIQASNLTLQQYAYMPGGDIHQGSEVAGSYLLYESLLVFENYPATSLLSQTAGLDLQISDLRSIGAQTKYAVNLLVTQGAQIEIRCVYDPRRLSTQSIEQLLAHFQRLLEAITTQSEWTLERLAALIPATQIPEIYSLAEARHLADYRPPRTPEEEMLTGVYAQILGLPRVGINDNFFELGGHSLLATQLVARVRSQFSLELPLRALFESPTVGELAAQITRLRAARQGTPKPAITSVSRESPLPASFAQQRLWFLDRLNPHTTAYNTPLVASLSGTLHAASLQRALIDLLQRHETLRTTFAEVDGEPVQIIASAVHLSLPLIDLQDLPASVREQEAARLRREAFSLPFDVSKGPLFRASLLLMDARQHSFVATIHHIAFDAWSGGVFISELAHLYTAHVTGTPPALPPLPIQYADFAVWQRAYVQGAVLREHLAYWQKQLNDAPPLMLPTDHPRPDYAHFHGRAVSFALSPELSEQIVALSRKEGVTVFMTLLTAFQVLLYRMTGQEDAVIGTDVANRLHEETELLIGFFVNLLVLRTDLSGQPRFLEALQRVRGMVLEAYAHQDLPFDLLVQSLHFERANNQIPLVRALFVQQNAPLPAIELPGLKVEVPETELTTAKFDLAVFVTETEQGLQGSVNYSSELFDPATIHRLIEHYQILLQSIVQNPEARIHALDMLSEDEKRVQEEKKTAHVESSLRKLKTARRSEPIQLREPGD